MRRIKINDLPFKKVKNEMKQIKKELDELKKQIQKVKDVNNNK